MTANTFFDRHISSDHRIRGRRRIAAVAVALVVVAAGLLGGAQSARADATPTPAAASAPVLTATVGSVGTARSGEPLRVAIDVDNPGDVEVTTGVAAAATGAAALSGPDAVRTWLDGSSDASLNEVASITTPVVGAGKRLSTAITAPATLPAVQSLSAGVYPLRVTLQAGGTSIERRGVFTILPTTAPTASTTVVVPITAPPANRTLIEAKDLADLTAPTGALTAALDGVDGTPAVLAVDPAVVASIRVLGTSAPPSATAWLERLMNLPNNRFALQFADADTATQFDAGLTELMQPLTLDSFMNPADFAPTAGASPAPTPDAVALPTLAELTDVRPTITGVLWPAAGTVDAPTLAGTPGTTLLVSSSQTSTGATGRVSDGGREFYVYDGPTSTTLRAAASTTDPGARGMLLSEMLATAYFSSAAAGAQPSLVLMERGGTLDPTATKAAVSALASTGRTLSTWQQLAAAPEAATQIQPAEPVADRVTAVKTLLDDAARIAAFSTVLDQPDLLVGRERVRLLQTIAATWITQPRWLNAYNAQVATTQVVLGSVKVVGGSDVNIVGSGVNLPVSVRNDLPFPVTANLVVEPADLRLTVQRVTPLQAPPSSTTRVRVPVTSGVSNGETAVRFSLVSPTGVQIGQTETIKLTVRADWERIGLIVLAGLVALLLVVGTLRTIRRRRRGVVEQRPSRRAARAAYRRPNSARGEETDG